MSKRNGTRSKKSVFLFFGCASTSRRHFKTSGVRASGTKTFYILAHSCTLCASTILSVQLATVWPCHTISTLRSSPWGQRWSANLESLLFFHWVRLLSPLDFFGRCLDFRSVPRTMVLTPSRLPTMMQLRCKLSCDFLTGDFTRHLSWGEYDLLDFWAQYCLDSMGQYEAVCGFLSTVCLLSPTSSCKKRVCIPMVKN